MNFTNTKIFETTTNLCNCKSDFLFNDILLKKNYEPLIDLNHTLELLQFFPVEVLLRLKYGPLYDVLIDSVLALL